MVLRLPHACVTTSEPRWRQTLMKARNAPFSSRATTTGTLPRVQVKKSPAFDTCSVKPTYCQLCRKIRSFSRANSAGSVYQLAGNVEPCSSCSYNCSEGVLGECAVDAMDEPLLFWGNKKRHTIATMICLNSYL